MGKSSLLAEFARRAQENGVPAALLDGQSQRSYVDLLRAARGQLAPGDPLRGFFQGFDEAVRRYLDAEQKVRGVGEALGAAGIALARDGVPFGVGAALVEAVGEERLRGLLSGRLPKSEVDLYLDAERTLTRRFVEGLDRLAAERSRAVLLFDTYEAMEHLDPWLREVFLDSGPDERVVLVIAGRNHLGEEWDGWSPLVRLLELAPFSAEEARQFLAGVDIREPGLVAAALDFTGRLPFALGVVADLKQGEGLPSDLLDASGAGDLRDRVVDRLLSHVGDRETLRLIECCAVLRRFDEGSLAALAPEIDVAGALSRLRRFSFVQRRGDRSALHDLVRDFLADDLRRRDIERYRSLNAAAARLYEQRFAASGGRDPGAALDRLYHQLRADEDRGMALFGELFDGALELRQLAHAGALLQTLDGLGLSAAHRGRAELAAALLPFHRGDWRRAAERLAALDAGGGLDPVLRTRVLGHQAVALRYLGDLERAIAVGEEHVEVNRARGDEAGMAQGLVNLAELHGLTGDLDPAEARLREAIAVFAGLGADVERMRALLYLDHCHRWQGRWQRALDRGREAEEIARRKGHDWGLARALYGRGRTFTFQGRLAPARGLLEEALGIFRHGESEQHVGEALSGLGILAREERDWAEAERRFAESRAVFESLGAELYVGWMLWNQGELARLRGDPAAALALVEESLERSGRMRYVLGRCLSLITLGQVHDALGEPARAEERFVAAVALLRPTGYRYDLARALVAWAAARRRAGRTAEVDVLAEEARGLAVEHGFDDQLALLDALAGPGAGAAQP